jgi:hypothetical protein
VLELLTAKFDPHLFAPIYQRVMASIDQKKYERKREASLLAVKNPKKHAMKKQQHNLKKKSRKDKRKFERHDKEGEHSEFGDRMPIKVSKKRV